MRECSPIEPCLYATTSQRRDRLVDRIRQSGCRFVQIQNSMQEMMAIMYLGKLGREARADLLSNLSVTERPDTSGGKVAPSLPSAEASAKASASEATDRISQAPAAPKSNLFEQSLQTTGRVISRQT